METSGTHFLIDIETPDTLSIEVRFQVLLLQFVFFYKTRDCSKPPLSSVLSGHKVYRQKRMSLGKNESTFYVYYVTVYGVD